MTSSVRDRLRLAEARLKYEEVKNEFLVQQSGMIISLIRKLATMDLDDYNLTLDSEMTEDSLTQLFTKEYAQCILAAKEVCK
jgi:hypothetical protein